MDNEPKHTVVYTLYKAIQWEQVEYSSMDMTAVWFQPKGWAAFHQLKLKLKEVGPTNEQQLKVAAVKGWQNISRKEIQNLVKSIDSKLQAVSSPKYYKW